MRSVSLLSVGLLLSVLTATAAFAHPEQPQLVAQIQPQTEDAMAPSKGKAAAKPLCPDNSMPMKLAERPATTYQDKGVRSTEPGKSIPQLKEEHHEMRDQMQANADCVPRK